MEVRVKICGITNSKDAQKAVDLGAWALGFVFYPKSPRYIEPKKVKEIIASLPKIKEDSGIQVLQLHGDENPDMVKELPGEVIKAVRVKTLDDIKGIPDFGNETQLLIDAPNAGESYGGTGELSDWHLAKKLKDKGQVILSGGLGPQNILAAFQEVRPFAIDLSSGVEKSPGNKDHQKLETLFSEIEKISQSEQGQ
jgi:phosphoribosylanthranilate isomerase